MFSILLLASILATSFGQLVTPDGCFMQWFGYGVPCGRHFERRSFLDQQQCLDLCTTTTNCRSVQYNTNTQQCDLFSQAFAVQQGYQAGGTSYGRKKRAIVGPGTSNDLTKSDDLTSFNQVNRAPQIPATNQTQSLVYPSGYVLIGPQNKTAGELVSQNSYPRHGQQPSQNIQHAQQPYRPRNYAAQPAAPKVGYVRQPAAKGHISCYQNPTAIQCPGYSYYVPSGRCNGGGPIRPPVTAFTQVPFTTRRPTTRRPNIPGEAQCRISEKAEFVEYEGIRLQGSDDSTFTARSEQECYGACADNQLPTGETVPCRSVDYNQNSGECSLSLDVLTPDGRGTPVDDRSSNHYQKICIDANTRCNGPFRRAPQQVLVGFADEVITTRTFEQCLAACTANRNCNSGQFYFDEPTLNCVINSETARTQPDLFAPATTDAVDYFETNCNNRKQFFSSRARRFPVVLRPSAKDAMSNLKPLSLLVPKYEQNFDSVSRRVVSKASRSGRLAVRTSESSQATWTTWTPCILTMHTQIRFRDCSRVDSISKQCDLEQRICPDSDVEKPAANLMLDSQQTLNSANERFYANDDSSDFQKVIPRNA